jgi:hypothetical protein
VYLELTADAVASEAVMSLSGGTARQGSRGEAE